MICEGEFFAVIYMLKKGKNSKGITASSTQLEKKIYEFKGAEGPRVCFN